MSGGCNNLYELIRARFPADAASTVMITETGRHISYAELEHTTARYANALSSLGVRPDDRVAVQIDKSPEALMVYLACLRAGAVYLPMNVAYRTSEVAHILDDAAPALMLCRPDAQEALSETAQAAGVRVVMNLGANENGSFAEAAAQCEERFQTCPREADDLAALLYTSGTTGLAKGVMLTHGNLASNALTLVEQWGWRDDDVLLHALPLFHTHGLFVACHCVLMTGTSMVFFPKFDVRQVLDALPQVTVLMGVPTFYVRLLSEQGFDASACRGVRLFVSGSAPLLEQTFREFEERTGQAILERYGMTETGMNTSNPLGGERRPGTIGHALPGVDVRIVDESGKQVDVGAIGELQIQGPNVFAGYWQQADKTAEEFTDDGYFHTGDLGRYDEDGYIVLVGRSKDMVISGGFNVYPKEVELLIDEIDGVKESAVIGLSHADLGEAVTAVVVRRSDEPAPTEEQIISALKHDLAGYKVPKRVFFVDDLPRNAMGKVQKNVLRQSLSL